MKLLTACRALLWVIEYYQRLELEYEQIEKAIDAMLGDDFLHPELRELLKSIQSKHTVFTDEAMILTRRTLRSLAAEVYS